MFAFGYSEALCRFDCYRSDYNTGAYSLQFVSGGACLSDLPNVMVWGGRAEGRGRCFRGRIGLTVKGQRSMIRDVSK